jgi:hypothetical protein
MIRCVSVLSEHSMSSSLARQETFMPDMISRAWMTVSLERSWGSIDLLDNRHVRFWPGIK